MKEHYGFADAAGVGALVLTMMNFGAGAAAMVASKHRGTGGSPISTHLPVLLALVILLLLLYTRPARSVAFLLTLGCVAGVFFGVFMLRTREHVNRTALANGGMNLLSSFNNLTNHAILIAFGTSFILSLLTRDDAALLLKAVISAMFAFLIAGSAFLLLWSQFARNGPAGRASATIS